MSKRVDSSPEFEIGEQVALTVDKTADDGQTLAAGTLGSVVTFVWSAVEKKRAIGFLYLVAFEHAGQAWIPGPDLEPALLAGRLI